MPAIRQTPADAGGRALGPRLLTVGHGTAASGELAARLAGAAVAQVVDVRTAPWSRRFPQYRRDARAPGPGVPG